VVSRIQMTDVHNAGVKQVWDIVGARPIVRLGVGGILDGGAAQRSDRDYAEAMRVRVVGQDGVVICKAVFDGSEHALVVRTDAIEAEVSGRVVLALRRVDQAEEPARLRVASAGTGGAVRSRRDRECAASSGARPRSGNIDRRVDFVAYHQMRCLIAKIGDCRKPVLSELVLYAEVPGLKHGWQSFGCKEGVGRVLREDIGRRREELQREGIASRNVAPWVIELIGAAGFGHR